MHPFAGVPLACSYSKGRHTYIHTYIHPDGLDGVHTYIHTHIQAHTYIHTYIQAYTHTGIHTHIYNHTYTHTHIHTYRETYTHIHTYIHTCIHTYIHTHIYIHTYTHIHTYMLSYIHTYILGFVSSKVDWCYTTGPLTSTQKPPVTLVRTHNSVNRIRRPPLPVTQYEPMAAAWRMAKPPAGRTAIWVAVKWFAWGYHRAYSNNIVDNTKGYRS